MCQCQHYEIKQVFREFSDALMMLDVDYVFVCHHNPLSACLSGRRISLLLSDAEQKNITAFYFAEFWLKATIACLSPCHLQMLRKLCLDLWDEPNFSIRIFTLKIKLKHRHIMAHGAVAGGQMRIICYKKTAEGGWDVCAPYKHLSHLTLHQVRSTLKNSYVCTLKNFGSPDQPNEVAVWIHLRNPPIVEELSHKCPPPPKTQLKGSSKIY